MTILSSSLTPQHLSGSGIIFFFNDPAPTEISTLSLHDALPISQQLPARRALAQRHGLHRLSLAARHRGRGQEQTRLERRSEEHTSELQSQSNLVCRLLLEKKKKNKEVSKRERKSVTHCRIARRH